jgi:phosphohistidine phosphatase
MKKISIIRHGKSLKSAYVSDKERPLIERGVADANLVSNHIKSNLEPHYTIISSTAKRAADTALIFATNLGYNPEDIIYMDELYTFDDRKFEQVIRNLDDSLHHILVIGHNPALTDFANNISNGFFENIPTSGLVEIEFSQEEWLNVKKGKVNHFVFAKKLR